MHSVQFFPYLLLELLKYSAPGVGTANLKTGTIIPSQVKDAPNWFIYFFQSNLPSEADAVDAQMMGLTLSTIGSQVWAKLIQEHVWFGLVWLATLGMPVVAPGTAAGSFRRVVEAP